MALKATIFKVDLSLADIDRNYYDDFSLTLARHPSENDARMMVRLLAFMCCADQSLAFGRGLSCDEEPDLWRKDLTGAVEQWILVGMPDERIVRKACGRAREVVVFAYGDKATDVWWAQNAAGFAKLANLRVMRISTADTQALAGFAERTMALQCTIQDGELMITGAAGTVHVLPSPMGTAV